MYVYVAKLYSSIKIIKYTYYPTHYSQLAIIVLM